MTARDGYGQLRHEAGSPASQGGRFAAEVLPAAATTLTASVDPAASAYEASRLQRAAVAIDRIAAVYPAAASVQADFHRDYEGTWVDVLVADVDGALLPLTGEQRDEIGHALLDLDVNTGSPVGQDIFSVRPALGQHPTPALHLDRRDEFRQRARAAFHRTGVPFPYTPERAEQAASALWTASTYDAALSVIDVIGDDHPDTAWVDVTIQEDEEGILWFGDGVDDQGRPVTERVVGALSDIGATMDDAAGSAIWGERIDGDADEGWAVARLRTAGGSTFRSQRDTALAEVGLEGHDS